MRHSRDNASRSLLLHISPPLTHLRTRDTVRTVSNPHQYSPVDVQSHDTHHDHRDRRHRSGVEHGRMIRRQRVRSVTVGFEQVSSDGRAL